MTVTKNHPQPQPLLLDLSNTYLDLSPAQLEQLRDDNPALKLELTEEGKLTIESKEIALTESELEKSNLYEFVELTPAETARRVTKVERFRSYQREQWDKLTSDEKAAHDRQFECLYALLDQSRS